MELCECGCGQEAKEGNRFIRGHHTRGVTLTNEHKKKLSEANLGRSLSEKHKRKIGEANSGANHHNWQGGISFEPYCSKFNNSFKESVRERFGRVCFLCGEREEDVKLDVHHVTYDKSCLCSEVECEFVPLCKRCHGKTTNGDREYYEKLILEKLEELKWVKYYQQLCVIEVT